MFDAKSLLEALMKGAQPQQPTPPPAGLGGLGDLLGKMMGQQSGGQAQAAPSGMPGLGDLLGKMMGQQGGGQAQASSPQQGASQQGSGGLEDMLRKLQEQLGGVKGGPSGQAGGQDGGGIADILKQVFGQATSGVKDGARKLDDMTGASGHAREATKSVTGQSPDDIMAQIKEWVSKNQMGAGAAAGGLGAVVLGTKTGRAMAGRAIKLGGLALIGGLAYKALENYQAGRPLLTGADTHLAEAPTGSGFETAAVTQHSASLYIKAMIAAAAADGRIDEAEQQKLMGSLKQVGLDAHAEEFLAQELNNPATIEQLAAAVQSEQEAVQVFTAARIAVDLDNQEEHDFLVGLAQALGIDGNLVQHIDAAARAA